MRHHYLFVLLSTVASTALAGCGAGSSAARSEPSTPAASAPIDAALARPAPSEASAAVGTGRELKAAGEAKVGDRTKCPTSGEEFVVSADSPKVEYKGKTYYFCCGGCDKKFASDPEKYLKRGPDA